MGREVRLIKAGWEHPFDHARGAHRPLLEPGRPIEELQAEWDRENRLWEMREHPDQLDPRWTTARETATYAEWSGDRPSHDQFMPFWPAGEATKLVMYEDTSEGTPLSPPFDTPEELARWCADNGVSAFGPDTATYDEWLSVCRGNPSIGLLYSPATGELRPDFAGRKP